MIEFFVEGGWGMWPILVFGMAVVGAAGRFMGKPALEQLRFIAAMGLTTLLAAFHATWIDVAMVFQTVSNPDRIPEAQVTRMLLVGLKESSRPGALGIFLLMLASLFVSIGMLRLGRKKD